MIQPINSIEALAADPEVRQALAQIPRNLSPQRAPRGKTYFPAASEADLLKGWRGDDPEKSLRGIIARVSLLESQVQRLLRKRK